MKLLIIFAAALAVTCSEPDYDAEEKKYHQDMALNFKEHYFPLNTRVALEANYYSKGHFIISAQSLWYILGSTAESFDEGEKKEFLSLLNLPDDQRLRQQFFSRAYMLEGQGEGIDFSRSQIVAVDETVDVKNGFTFDKIPIPVPSYLQSVTFDKPFGHVQKFVMRGSPNLHYSSHTVLVDHLMFEGLWSSAFSERPVQEGPFYNKHGDAIATVEYLTMKDKVRTASFPDNSAKVLEVPLGTEGKHTMLFAVGDEIETMIKALFRGNIFANLILNEEPIEVAIPRLSMSSGIDMGPIFKNMKRSKEFTDPASYSELDTSALPLGYYQIVSANMTDSVGREEAKVPKGSYKEDDFAALETSGFLVNKPFLFALCVSLPETDVKLPVFTGAYSYPGERGKPTVVDVKHVLDSIL